MTKRLMPKLRLLLWLAAAGAATAVLAGPTGPAVASTGATASRRGILPPRNPSASLLPAPSFLSSCSPGDDGSACNRLALAAIGHARRVLEGLGGMSFSLPAYEKLTRAEQLFVVVDLERTERGLPPAGVLSRSLDAIAQAGAEAGRDPAPGAALRRLPGGGQVVYAGVIWAGGWTNPLGSDYGWMYDDGPGGTNLACSAARPRLCWGHRDIILTAFPSRASCGGGAGQLAMGTGHAAWARGYGESDTMVLAGVCGPAPADAAFTWAAARKLLHIG